MASAEQSRLLSAGCHNRLIMSVIAPTSLSVLRSRTRRRTAPLLLDWKVEYTPVATILEPGITWPVRYLRVHVRESTCSVESGIVSPSSPIRRKPDVPWQLSDGHGVRRLLELDDLLVDKAAFLVNNHVGIQRALLWLARDGLACASAGKREAGEPARNCEVRDVPAALAHDVQLRRAGGEYGGGDDDAWEADELADVRGLEEAHKARATGQPCSRCKCAEVLQLTCKSRNWSARAPLRSTTCTSAPSRSAILSWRVCGIGAPALPSCSPAAGSYSVNALCRFARGVKICFAHLRNAASNCGSDGRAGRRERRVVRR